MGALAPGVPAAHHGGCRRHFCGHDGLLFRRSPSSPTSRFSIRLEVKRWGVPPGVAELAWEAHWVAAARFAWGSGSDLLLREVLDHIPGDAHLFCSADSPLPPPPIDILDEELVAARIRTLHRSQTLADFAAELGCARNDEEKHATRHRFARPLDAWGRRLIDASRPSGSFAPTAPWRLGSRILPAVLADHWAPVFGEGDDINDNSADFRSLGLRSTWGFPSARWHPSPSETSASDATPTGARPYELQLPTCATASFGTVYCLSVLHFLGQLAPADHRTCRVESARFVSRLEALMHAVTWPCRLCPLFDCRWRFGLLRTPCALPRSVSRSGRTSSACSGTASRRQLRTRVLRAWLRRILAHLLECRMVDVEFELVVVRLEWAFRDSPFCLSVYGSTSHRQFAAHCSQDDSVSELLLERLHRSRGR